MEIEKMLEQVSPQQLKKAEMFKLRLLEYPNPVEFVNNMYGSHPTEIKRNYFQAIYH